MTDTKPTTVLFRIEDDGNAVAFFPEEPSTMRNDFSVICYARTGQHSESDWRYYSMTRAPRSERDLVEVDGLRKVLIGHCGYTLNERVRWTQAMDHKRREAFRALLALTF